MKIIISLQLLTLLTIIAGLIWPRKAKALPQPVQYAPPKAKAITKPAQHTSPKAPASVTPAPIAVTPDSAPEKLSDEALAAKWIERATKTAKQLPRTEVLAAALLRYPTVKPVFSELFSQRQKLLESPLSLDVKRLIITELISLSENFQRNCNPGDLGYAARMVAKSSELGDDLIEEARSLQRESISFTLDEIAAELTKLAANMARPDAALDKLAQLDASLDDAIINNFPELKSRRAELTEKTIEIVSKPRQPSGSDDVKAYNRRAIAAANSAFARFGTHDDGKLFSSGSVNFNIASNQQVLINDLGGWDTALLLPSTSMFVNQVYGEIFQKLNHEGRVSLASLMVNAAPQKA